MSELKWSFGLQLGLVDRLMAERKKLKAEMKLGKDSNKRAVLEAREICYHTTLNSLYGFTAPPSMWSVSVKSRAPVFTDLSSTPTARAEILRGHRRRRHSWPTAAIDRDLNVPSVKHIEVD